MLDRTDDISVAAESWLARFESALKNPGELKALFHSESYWRDVLALSWNIQTVNGAEAILEELERRSRSAAPKNFQIDPGRAAPRRVTRAGITSIETMFKFETAVGRGNGGHAPGRRPQVCHRFAAHPGNARDLKESCRGRNVRIET